MADNNEESSSGTFGDQDLEESYSDIETKSANKAAQAGLEIVGGAIPFAGGLAAWIAGNCRDRNRSVHTVFS